MEEGTHTGLLIKILTIYSIDQVGCRPENSTKRGETEKPYE